MNDWRPGDDLTDVEQLICRGSEAGQLVNASPGPYHFAAMRAWGTDRTVRASVLRHLILADEWPVHQKGVQLHGFRISGRLDLDSAIVRCPLQLESCYFPEAVSLTGSTVSLFVMKDCHVAGLVGDALMVSRFLDFGGSTFAGPVRLMLADIRGGLNCRSCHLSNPDADGIVLFAERIRVGGNVFLDMNPGQRPFLADGTLRMTDATIAGDLSCVGARLTLAAQNEISLMAQRIKVGGNVFLTSHPGETKFTAQGTINLVGADIVGAVDCSGASLGGGRGDALTGAGMKVGFGVLLGSGFTAAGAVDLRGADISANLVCHNGTQLNGVNADGNALNATSMKVGGYLRFNDGFTAAGAVNLVDADITADVEVLGVQLGGANITGSSLTARGIKIGGNMVLGDGLAATGAINLEAADISANLVFRGDTRINGVNADGNALQAGGMTVGGHVLIRDNFAAQGAVCLIDADVAGNLECRGVQLHSNNKAGSALNAERIKVGSQVFLDQGFSAEGTIYLLGANIAGNLECRGARIRSKIDRRAIYAERMTVGGDVYLDTTARQDKFTAEGTVYLLKANIGGILSCRGAQLKTLSGAGNVFFAERMNVGSNVYLSDGFSASGNIQLKEATIGGSLEIEPYALEKDKRLSALDATDIRVSGRLRWAPETQTQGRVSLEGATVGQLEDSWTEPDGGRRENGYWPTGGRLCLDGFTYGSLAGNNQPDVRQRLQWIRSQLRPKLPEPWVDIRTYAGPANFGERGFAAQPYKQLTQAYQHVGKDTEARKVSIAQRRDRRKYGHLTWYRKMFDWLLDFFVGYGYETWRAGAALLVLFGIVFTLMLVAMNNNAFEPVQNATLLHPAPSAARCRSGYPCFNPLGYTIDTVIPLIDVHQVDYWGPNAKTSWGLACVYITYLGTALGWFFATLTVAGATGIIRRIDPS